MRRSLFVLTGTMVAGLGILVAALAAQGNAGAIDVDALIKQDVGYIQENVGKKPGDKKVNNRLRMAALLVATYAQNSMAKDPASKAKMATLRDQALKVLKAIEDNKSDEAQKLAKSLSPDIAPAAGAKTEPIPLNKHLDYELVMRIYSATRVGGFGLEKMLDEFAELKGNVDAETQGKIHEVAGKSAQIALLAESYGPETDKDKQTKKAWSESAKEMHQASLALAAAGKNKDAAAVAKAAQALSSSCVKCHDIFR